MPEETRSYETLARIIEILGDPDASKLVVVHHNGDPDALGSALALQAVFPEIKIGAPLGLSTPARHLLDAVGGSVLEKPRYEAFDYIIIVDTSSRVQLGEDAERIKEPIILDHHAYHDTWEDALYLYVDPNKAACCELIYELIEIAADEEMTDFSFSGAGVDIARLETVGLSLMTGIWTDTGGFRHATPRTFQIAANLLSVTGTSMTDVLGVLEREPEFHDGKAEAQLKAAQRLHYERIGGLLVATSHVSAYEAAAARIMTLMGADIGFCVADNNKEIRASGRARREAVASHQIHLGHLMNRVGKELGFMGGGHDGAAGMNLPKKDAERAGKEIPTPEIVLAALIAGLKEDLRIRDE
jgi:nanoRNase/pAp phosphatase (c-di-AMP/oligoRNAs hydrolase)